MMYWVHLAWTGFELTTLMVIGTDSTVSCKSNYHTITITTAPFTLQKFHFMSNKIFTHYWNNKQISYFFVHNFIKSSHLRIEVHMCSLIVYLALKFLFLSNFYLRSSLHNTTIVSVFTFALKTNLLQFKCYLPLC